MNVQEVPKIYELTQERKAIALYLFLLVPVGCGVQIAQDQMLTAAEVEEWLRWVAKKDQEGPLPLKAICAPHYFRVEYEGSGTACRATTDPPPEISTDRKGCLAGLHMCFITHKGDVYPCGYLPLSAGNLREKSLRDIWDNSELFRSLRDSSLLKGRCGACDFKDVCGGCRARGLYAHGDVLAEEPFCAYEPEPQSPSPLAS